MRMIVVGAVASRSAISRTFNRTNSRGLSRTGLMTSWRLPLSCSSERNDTGRNGGSFDSLLVGIRLDSSQFNTDSQWPRFFPDIALQQLRISVCVMEY